MHYKLRSTAVVQCTTPSPSIQIHLQRVQRKYWVDRSRVKARLTKFAKSPRRRFKPVLILFPNSLFTFYCFKYGNRYYIILIKSPFCFQNLEQTLIDCRCPHALAEISDHFHAAPP